MLDYGLKVGIVPLRRDVTPRPGIFNWEFAEKRGREITEYIIKNYTDEQTKFVDIVGVNPVNTMFTEADAEWISEKFKAENVDCVLFVNANFGNEEAVSYVAQNVGKPVCIWAPLDDTFEKDGTRYTDSQCGVFGVSRILQRLNIPFSHIRSCRVEEEIFGVELNRFLNVSCMVKNFKGIRIGNVGLRPKPFTSVMFNEGELMQKFGIRCIPVNMAVIIDKYNKILETRQKELEEGEKLLLSRYEMDDLTPPLLKKVYAFVLLYKDLTEEYNLDAISAECWTSMQLGVGAMPCTAYSILADMGYVISCESDMHACISMVLLRCASRGKSVPFLGEFTVRHPEDKNVELLWHCGPFAYSLKHPESKAKEVNMRQWFRVKDGKYTICRFDQDNGNYSLLNGNVESAEGPYTFGTYLWGRFSDLQKWEDKLIDGPYIHHMTEIEGDYTAEFKEFCKYIPNLSNDYLS